MNLYRKKGIVFGMFVLLLRVMVFSGDGAQFFNAGDGLRITFL